MLPPIARRTPHRIARSLVEPSLAVARRGRARREKRPLRQATGYNRRGMRRADRIHRLGARWDIARSHKVAALLLPAALVDTGENKASEEHRVEVAPLLR